MGICKFIETICEVVSESFKYYPITPDPITNIFIASIEKEKSKKKK